MERAHVVAIVAAILDAADKRRLYPNYVESAQGIVSRAERSELRRKLRVVDQLDHEHKPETYDDCGHQRRRCELCWVEILDGD